MDPRSRRIAELHAPVRDVGHHLNHRSIARLPPHRSDWNQLFRLERADGNEIDVTREQVGHKDARVEEDADDKAVDLGATQEVVIEGNAFDEAALGPVPEAVRTEADELSCPV